MSLAWFPVVVFVLVAVLQGTKTHLSDTIETYGGKTHEDTAYYKYLKHTYAGVDS